MKFLSLFLICGLFQFSHAQDRDLQWNLVKGRDNPPSSPNVCFVTVSTHLYTPVVRGFIICDGERRYRLRLRRRRNIEDTRKILKAVGLTSGMNKIREEFNLEFVEHYENINGYLFIRKNEQRN